MAEGKNQALQSIVNSFTLVDPQNTNFFFPDRVDDPVAADTDAVGFISVLDLLVRQGERILGEELEFFHNSAPRYSIEPVERLLRLPAESDFELHSSGYFSPFSISASISSSSFSSSSLNSSKPKKLSSLLLMISSCFSIRCRCSRMAFSCMLDNLLVEVDKSYLLKLLEDKAVEFCVYA